VFAVKPTKVLAFGKGEFSHTRYRPSWTNASHPAAMVGAVIWPDHDRDD
jgi:hypothetical protein